MPNNNHELFCSTAGTLVKVYTVHELLNNAKLSYGQNFKKLEKDGEKTGLIVGIATEDETKLVVSYPGNGYKVSFAEVNIKEQSDLTKHGYKFPAENNEIIKMHFEQIQKTILRHAILHILYPNPINLLQAVGQQNIVISGEDNINFTEEYIKFFKRRRKDTGSKYELICREEIKIENNKKEDNSESDSDSDSVIENSDDDNKEGFHSPIMNDRENYTDMKGTTELPMARLRSNSL